MTRQKAPFLPISQHGPAETGLCFRLRATSQFFLWCEFFRLLRFRQAFRWEVLSEGTMLARILFSYIDHVLMVFCKERGINREAWA